MKTHNFQIVNLDTDSVSFCKKDGSPFTEEEQENLLKDLNSNYPPQIKFEHDGIYPKVCILKAKNYILKSSHCDDCKKKNIEICPHESKKIKKKGSALKSSKVEKGLSEFMGEIIDALIYDKQHTLLDIYNKYIREVHNLTDISRYCGKKTITHAVLNPERSTEQKILDALQGKQVQQGDKIWLYFTEVTKQIEVPINKKGVIVGYKTKTITEYPLKLQENWNNDHSIDKLIAKIYKTLLIFKNVIDIDQFPKYHLKNKNIQNQLQEMLKSQHNIDFNNKLQEIIK